ncbi:hypothetical protein D5R40_29460 [Okeania hirsuta]|uniref:Uncharacterized protein n=1 Tax=Okeania hirsuta TaxID=1458930 RepID=A0A3N6R3J0_9CYAN|nr:hypothetical protein [Okeania hirsuta]RQH25079.1 hypothetical protein D5R40_29460 [Okeania hirsuta]
MIKLTIKDETATGGLLQEWELPVENEWVSVRDLIAQRVKAEVEEYNNKQESSRQLLVNPTPKEQALNLFSILKSKFILPGQPSRKMASSYWLIIFK